MKLPYSVVRFLYLKMRFGSISWSTSIEKQLRINGSRNIFFSPYSSVHKYCWLAAEPLTGNSEAILEIGKGSTIGDFAHIYATKKIVIENDVLIANFVYISDNVHGYKNIHKPIMHQNVIQLNTVRIGEGSWLGEHVSVIGANIGRHCVIGSNSVVTHDVPDYSVAVGAPARVIKKYNKNTGEWEQVNNQMS